VACKSGREAIVELLLEIGADPLLENKHGKTPFQWATDFGQVYVYIIRIMMY
jgi:ankyrin repeat protein